MFLAITLARSRSKRLKNKNIMKIFNSNLLEISYIRSIKSKFIKNIFLSTESNKIALMGKKIGYIVPFKRPHQLAKDNSRSEAVILDFLKKIKKKFKYLILLQPTSPLRTSKHIDNAINKYLRGKYDSLISVSYSLKKQKFSVGIKKNYLTREKNKFNNKYLFINGAIYISNIKKFLKNKSFFSRKTGFFLMPKKYSLDVDTKKDIQSFKKLFKNDKKIT